MKKKSIPLSSTPVTAAKLFASNGAFQERCESVAERVDKWYIQPLKRMQGSEGFLVLMVLFPLYEKHLRIRYRVRGDFSEGHRVFRVIGRHLALGEKDASLFWTHRRNGLLHRAAPKVSEKFEYGIRENAQPIEKIENHFWINPFALRDRLLQEIEPDTRTWKDDDVPLAKTFDRVDL